MPTDVSHLPNFLQPKLRLFLSADLVGSTNFKQFPRFPLTDPTTFWKDNRLFPSWLSPIADFYANFNAIFREEWEQRKHRVGKDYHIPIGANPVLWKANGDELIYYKDIRDRRELFVCIDAWKSAVLRYQENLHQTGPLDLKATAWTAGFPITNVEIVFEPTLEGAANAAYQDDARLHQFNLLSKFYETPEKNSGLILDFLGPTIDSGFRLTTKATPRKMVISVDVAYLLATTHIPDETEAEAYLKRFKIKYDGRVDLKGVLGGKPYPLFWIDMHHDQSIANTEDAILGSQKHLQPTEISAFCNAFYGDTRALMMKPFIVYEEAGQYGKIPENYMACLNHLNERWNAEKERYEGEKKGLEGASPLQPTDGQQEASVQTKEEMIKLILSKSTRSKSDDSE